MVGETGGCALEQVVGKDAVVVGKRDDVCSDSVQASIPCTRQTALGTYVLDRERVVLSQHLLDPIVVVLIDEQYAKSTVSLPLE